MWLGWLFADMLLALAMLFLLANTSVMSKPSPPSELHTPSPSLSSTPALHALEHNYCEIRLLTSDPSKLSSNISFAISELEPLIKKQDVLRGRQVGLAIVGAGAPTYQQSDEEAAGRVASQVIKVLQDLGRKQFAFIDASYYDPISFDQASSDIIIIEVYLIAQKGHASETCNASNHQPI